MYFRSSSWNTLRRCVFRWNVWKIWATDDSFGYTHELSHQKHCVNILPVLLLTYFCSLSLSLSTPAVMPRSLSNYRLNPAVTAVLPRHALQCHSLEQTWRGATGDGSSQTDRDAGLAWAFCVCVCVCVCVKQLQLSVTDRKCASLYRTKTHFAWTSPRQKIDRSPAPRDASISRQFRRPSDVHDSRPLKTQQILIANSASSCDDRSVVYNHNGCTKQSVNASLLNYKLLTEFL